MKKAAILIIGILIFSACDDNFLEEIPQDFLATENYFRDEDDAIATVNSAYNAMIESEGRFYAIADLTTEVVTTWILQFETGGAGSNDCCTFDANWGNLLVEWNRFYSVISRANYTLKNVGDMDESKFSDIEIKDRVLGEAYFLRAFSYFGLVRIFGGVPLRIEAIESASEAEGIARNSESEVYDQIIADLELAIDLLPQNSTYSSDDLGRASKGAAKALIAKAYLQRGSLCSNNGITGDRLIAQSDDFQNAADYCQEVIDDGEYQLIEFENLWGFNAVGNDLNAEVIFAIQHSAAVNTNISLYRYVNLRNSDLPTSPLQYFQPSLEFYKSFDSTDIRKEVLFYMEYVNDGDTIAYDIDDPLNDGYFSDTPAFLKYVDRNVANETDEIILRYADILLMKAEALNEVNNGPTADAYSAINEVRSRAGLEDLVGLSYTDFKKAVYIERQKEFVMEGHGWFDGQRYFSFFQERQQEYSGYGESPRYGARYEVTLEEKHRLFPINQTIMDADPMLVQNEGW